MRDLYTNNYFRALFLFLEEPHIYDRSYYDSVLYVSAILIAFKPGLCKTLIAVDR
jgi:hypothetical protein